jgi:DNA repair exonuclease SbcCD nuclease subunit
MKQPKAILISDIHYNLNNLEIADFALRKAIKLAKFHQIPLILCGDTHDSKANLRAECANAMIATFQEAMNEGVKTYTLVGNHCRLNEKGEDHALNFLAPYTTIINKRETHEGLGFIPYQCDPNNFYACLSLFDRDTIVIAHQGVTGGQLGHYVIDKSAVELSKLIDHKRIFLGHYHAHYTLGNTVSVGTPYTQSFAEAKDHPKGVLLLYSNGDFDHILFNFRKHVIIEVTHDQVPNLTSNLNPNDLLWLKIKGPESELRKIDKIDLGKKLLGHANYKLDLISDAVENRAKAGEVLDEATPIELFDNLIDKSKETEEQKKYLKDLLRSLL